MRHARMTALMVRPAGECGSGEALIKAGATSTQRSRPGQTVIFDAAQSQPTSCAVCEGEAEPNPLSVCIGQRKFSSSRGQAAAGGN